MAMNDRGHSFEYFAFISYSHHDLKLAKWLQRRLEAFRLPTKVQNDVKPGGKYLRPIFRDQSDLNTGILNEELRKNLENSKFLILICSKYSAVSPWVSAEAKAFVEMGKLDRIIPVFAGEGSSESQDLFPEFLREYFKAHEESELLGINLREGGKEKTLIKIVSRMLGISFDSLWKRHQRQNIIRRAIALSILSVALVCAYLFAVPVELSVDIEMEDANLPMGEEVILVVDGAEYKSQAGNSRFEGIMIPGARRFSDISLAAESQFYAPVDTNIETGFGSRRYIRIRMRRDVTFSNFAGTVYDENLDPVAGASVKIADRKVQTDADGRFCISLPLEEQRPEIPITIEKKGFKPIYREDEVPGEDLRYILVR